MLAHNEFNQLILLASGLILMQWRNKHLMMLFIIIYLKLTVVSPSVYMLAIIGLVMAPLIVNFTYFIVFKKWLFSYRKNKTFNFDFLRLVNNAIIEEIIWRDLILNFFLTNLNSFLMLIIVLLIFSYFFVKTHKVKSSEKVLEMVIFSFIISILSVYAFGAHYGLHVGRNLYIEIFLNQEGENI